MLTWFDVDQKFRELLPELGGLRIDVQWGEGSPEHFRLAGSYRDKNELRRFEALAGIAGNKLSEQLQSASDVPDEVASESDPVLLWYKALWHIGRGLEYDFTAFEMDEDGNRVGNIHAGTIPEAVKVSSAFSLLAYSKWGEPEKQQSVPDVNEETATGWRKSVLGFLNAHLDEIIVGLVISVIGGLIVGLLLMVF